jgi:opacity protein-like surface antigen
MRAWTLVFLSSWCVLATAAPAAAQDAGALRKEIEALQKQLQSLGERLLRLEAQPAPPATTAAPPAAAPGAALGISAADLARPRPPFSLYQQRGAGQLLFDMGIAGDFVGNVTQANVEKARGGSFGGQENRFFPREVELSLFGQVDPYAYAEVRIETGEETRGGEMTMKLAEAAVTMLTLPFGTQAKFGQMRNRFGYSNSIHEHDLPWIDRPNVLRNFLGGEGLQEKGVEITIVPDLPFYLEGLVGVFNGDNETAFGRGTLRVPMFTGRLRTFLELGDASALQLGMSVASGETTEKRRDTILGWEGRYKYRPEGWLHPLVTVTGEALYALRRVNVEVDTDGDGMTDLINKRERDRFGWYLGAEVQPFRRWAAGVRYDWTQFPDHPGSERAIEPYVSFWPSEFLRFRLAYKNTERTLRDGFDADGGSARRVDEILFQGTFILGAHPAHPF